MKMATREEQLLKIAQEIESCIECREGKLGRAVAGEGSAYAEIAFIGEAPGKEEAKVGRPFIGRSGKFLRSMIREIGLEEKEVFITSPVKYLPRRGTPTKADIPTAVATFSGSWQSLTRRSSFYWGTSPPGPSWSGRFPSAGNTEKLSRTGTRSIWSLSIRRRPCVSQKSGKNLLTISRS